MSCGSSGNKALIVAAVACLGVLGSIHAASAAEVASTASAVESRPLDELPSRVDAGAVAADVPVQASAADRLRDDPLETAPVPLKPAAPPAAPVKLTKDQRAVAGHITRTYGVDRGSIERIVHYAYKSAREFRLDPHLILAVMAVESGFDANAKSHAGAKGLMQVHMKVHSDRFEPFGGTHAVFDPPANIKVGTGILSEYVTRYGDVAAGLKAYVGAALLPTDRGYGNKVLNRQAEFAAVVRPDASPTREAKADPSEPAPVQPAGATLSSNADPSTVDASKDATAAEAL
jgi:soluble lytic murein transglycosylase-like protein